MPEKIRVIRVLEYSGTRANVETALNYRKVKGNQTFGTLQIREAIVGDFPEVVESPEGTNPS